MFCRRRRIGISARFKIESLRVRRSPPAPSAPGPTAEAPALRAAECWFKSSGAHHGRQARLEERRIPNPALQGSNPWSPAKSLAPEGKAEEPPGCNPGVSGFDARPVLQCGGAGRNGLPPVSKTDAPKGWGFDSSLLRQSYAVSSSKLKIIVDFSRSSHLNWICVIQRFHFGGKEPMAQRTVNTDARPGT